MKKALLVLALFLLLAAGCVRVKLPPATFITGSAQEDLAWQRAVELALARHPDLRKAREELAAKRHNRNQALGAYLPSADGTIARKHFTESSTSNDTLSVDLDITQPIFAGFEITGEAMQAWRQWDAARFSYIETSASVRRLLRTEFVELLRFYKLFQVNQRIAQRRQDNADMLKLRYDSGREHEGSWRRAQAIAEQAVFDVRQAGRRIESQSLTLGRHLGGTFTTAMPLEGDLEQLLPAEPQAPGNYAALAEAIPGVLGLTRSAEASKAAVIASQAGLWPTVDGTFNYGYSGTRPGDLEKEDTTLGFTVSVPLFNGGQNVQGVLESNAGYRAAVEAARSARDAAIAQLSGDWAAFRDAWELVAVRRSFLEAARQRAEIVRAQYTNGLASFQDFDIAEQELADSEKSYVQSLSDVLTEEADWNAGLGKTLEEASHAR